MRVSILYECDVYAYSGDIMTPKLLVILKTLSALIRLNTVIIKAYNEGFDL